MTLTIYHNPACGTSRNTLEMMRQSGEDPVVIEYLQAPPTREKLVALRDYLETFERKLALGQVITPGLFNRMIKDVADESEKALIMEAVLRSQTQAYYGPRNAGRIVPVVSITSPGMDEAALARRLHNEDGIITRVIGTNLTYRTPELKAAPWFVEADMSKYVSFIIATLNHDRSLSKLLNPYDRIRRLVSCYQDQQAAQGIRLV